MRVVALAAAALVLASFVIAAFLVPDARGHGTHEQLGLPPCTFYVWFGRRCPACGMTTAWAHLARGNVKAAMTSHATGTLLALGAAIGSVWLGMSGIAGSWTPVRPREELILWVAVGSLIGMLAEWAVRLAAH